MTLAAFYAMAHDRRKELGPVAMLEPGDVVNVACDCGLEGCALRAHVVGIGKGRVEVIFDRYIARGAATIPSNIVDASRIVEIREAIGARGDFV